MQPKQFVFNCLTYPYTDPTGHACFVQHGLVLVLNFHGRDIAVGFQQPFIVEPVYPCQLGIIDGLK